MKRIFGNETILRIIIASARIGAVFILSLIFFWLISLNIQKYASSEDTNGKLNQELILQIQFDRLMVSKCIEKDFSRTQETKIDYFAIARDRPALLDTSTKRQENSNTKRSSLSKRIQADYSYYTRAKGNLFYGLKVMLSALFLVFLWIVILSFIRTSWVSPSSRQRFATYAILPLVLLICTVLPFLLSIDANAFIDSSLYPLQNFLTQSEYQILVDQRSNAQIDYPTSLYVLQAIFIASFAGIISQQSIVSIFEEHPEENLFYYKGTANFAMSVRLAVGRYALILKEKVPFLLIATLFSLSRLEKTEDWGKMLADATDLSNPQAYLPNVAFTITVVVLMSFLIKRILQFVHECCISTSILGGRQ
ncbi:MAG: hypothetical protein CL916_00060 [Deltaproteobacteria bacterium]|nr:hypothetical protein [Deltaproteobacteria bacterium]